MQAILLAAVLQSAVVFLFVLAPEVLSARLYALQELVTYPGNRFFNGRQDSC